MASNGTAPQAEDAGAQTRVAAKWLIAAFASVGTVLVSGLGLSELGDLEDTRFWLAIAGVAVGVLGVLIAISLITDVLAPVPVTLRQLADWQDNRNNRRGARNDAMVAYVEDHPALLQGIAGRRLKPAEQQQSLCIASDAYEEALDRRWEQAQAYWDSVKDKGQDAAETKRAEEAAKVANNEVVTMHDTVRRLERLANEQLTVFKFRARQLWVVVLAGIVAVGVGVFAIASNPPDSPTADLHGAQLKDVDLSGASLRGADMSGMTLTRVNLYGTNLDGADIDKTKWEETICPDGVNSDNAGESCEGHMDPGFRPDPLE